MKSLTDSINEGLLSSIPKDMTARISSFKTNLDLEMAVLSIEEDLRKYGAKEIIRDKRKPYGDDPDQKIEIPKNSYTIVFTRDGDEGQCVDITVYNPGEKKLYFAGFLRGEKTIFSQAYYPSVDYSVAYIPGRTAFMADSRKAENYIKDLCRLLNNLKTAGRHDVTFSSLYEN